MRRKKKSKRRRLSTSFPQDEQIRAAWAWAKKVDPRLLELMERNDANSG